MNVPPLIPSHARSMVLPYGACGEEKLCRSLSLLVVLDLLVQT